MASGLTISILLSVEIFVFFLLHDIWFPHRSTYGQPSFLSPLDHHIPYTSIHTIINRQHKTYLPVNYEYGENTSKDVLTYVDHFKLFPFNNVMKDLLFKYFSTGFSNTDCSLSNDFPKVSDSKVLFFKDPFKASFCSSVIGWYAVLILNFVPNNMNSLHQILLMKIKSMLDTNLLGRCWFIGKCTKNTVSMKNSSPHRLFQSLLKKFIF